MWTHYTETVACLEKDLIERTIPGQRRGRLKMSWLDNVKARTRLRLERQHKQQLMKTTVEEWLMTQPTVRPRTATERTELTYLLVHRTFCTRSAPHQVIHHLEQIWVYLEQLRHCITPADTCAGQTDLQTDGQQCVNGSAEGGCLFAGRWLYDFNQIARLTDLHTGVTVVCR